MTQGSADPPEHVRERLPLRKLQGRSPNADADPARRAKDGAREPAPGEADPLAEGPSNDRRRRVF